MQDRISDDDIACFRKNGYMHVPAAIDPQELCSVRQTADEFIAIASSVPAQWQEDFKFGSLVGDPETDEDASLCRVEYPLGKSPELFALAAHPCVLEVAYKLHGGPSVLTWEDLIVKVPNIGVAVPFHQDLLYQSVHSAVFSIGVYIDDSGVSPLLALPGTQQLGPLSNERIRKLVDEKASEVVRLDVKAGDLLIHNVLMVHGSRPNKGPNPRRVIYFEFRTLDQLRNDSPWDEDWINTRAKYIPAALQTRRSRSFTAASTNSPHQLEWERQFGGSAAAFADLNLRVHHDDIAASAAATAQ